MKKKTTIKIVSLAIIIGIVLAVSTIYYLLNMPHRDVQSSKTDYSLTSSQIVTEYLDNWESANQKYLAQDGNSKILEITGTVNKITENFNKQAVVLLKEKTDKAGVSATFTNETSQNTAKLSIGQKATIKGVIRSGASYDEDLGLYENVILDKCDLVK